MRKMMNGTQNHKRWRLNNNIIIVIIAAAPAFVVVVVVHCKQKIPPSLCKVNKAINR